VTESDTYRTIHAAIVGELKRQHMTHVELAKRIGVHRQVIDRIVNRGTVSSELADRILAELDVRLVAKKKATK
jgi:plasmid maintenance system antidote protein VapI